MKTTTDMTEGKPVRLILSFAVPMMFANIFQQFYNVFDSLVVGRLIGVNAFAAVGAAGFYSWMIISIILGMVQGYSVLYAHRFGAGDMQGLRKAIGMTVILSLVIGILLTLISILCAKPVLSMIHTPDEIMEDTRKYLYWLLAGTLFTLAYNVTASILRALGNSKAPLLAVVLSSITNIVLDLILIGRFHMGVDGAAISTVFATLCSFLYCLRKLHDIKPIHLCRSDFRIDSDVIKELLRLGSPLAFRNAVISFGGLTVQYAVNGFGTLFVAGTTAAKKYFGIMELVGSSIDGAFATFVGQNYGKGSILRIKEGLHSVRRLALAGSAIMALFMIVFGRILIGFLVSGDAVEVNNLINIGYHNITVIALCLPALYLLYLYRSALQGMGNTLIPMLSGFIELALRIFSALFLSKVIREWGIYLADGIGWIGAGALLFTAYQLTMKHLKEASY